MSKKGLFFVILAAATLFITIPACFAEDYLSANDLEAEKLSEIRDIDGFIIYARADKGVTIEAIDEARVAPDGEVFNARVKLNGGGAVDYRSIAFSAVAGQTVSIYLNSSSKTDARTLKFVDLSSGTVLAELAAPPDDGENAGLVELELSEDGDYVVFSASSGINIYMIYIE